MVCRDSKELYELMTSPGPPNLLKVLTPLIYIAMTLVYN